MIHNSEMTTSVKYHNGSPRGAVAALLDGYRSAPEASARVLLVTLFGDALHPGRQPVWISDLVALTAPFGVSERLLRTSLNRLMREGVLASERQGRQSRYSVHPEAAPTFDRAATRIYAVSGPAWDGKWTLLVGDPDWGSAGQRRRLRRELSWLGFGELAPTSHASPTLEPAVLEDLPEDLGAGVLMATRGEALLGGPGDADLAGLLLRPPALLDRMADLMVRFGEVHAAAGDLEPADAFVVRCLLVDAHRRIVLGCPELPGELVPEGGVEAGYRRFVAELYRRLFPASEALLAERFPAGVGPTGRFA